MYDITRKEQDLPAASGYLSEAEFLQETSLALEELQELVHLDWLEAVRIQDNMLFRPDDIARVDRLVRLCRDFELSMLGGTIVVDLLDRIAVLEDEVRRLRNMV